MGLSVLYDKARIMVGLHAGCKVCVRYLNPFLKNKRHNLWVIRL
jgi:hypothetical protein